MVKRNNRFQIERLEDRKMMAGDTAILLLAATQMGGGDMVFVGGAAGSNTHGEFPTEVFDPADPPEHMRDEAMGLPKLDSLPGAQATLFLDFTGNFELAWWQHYNGKIDNYSNVVTPAYDTDGNAAAFSVAEQQEIRDIWSAVAEDFAPFNINVTTHYYGGLGNNQALKVAIGGEDDDWLIRPEDKNPTGTSERGSFYNSAANTVFVFEDNLQSNFSTDRWKIATTASHEAGHAFGLYHRSKWGTDGKIVNEYDPGTDVWTPIMGANASVDRTTWSLGTSELGPNSLQDDMKILAGSQNGFGYRADDHGGWLNTATPLAAPMTAFQATTGKGVITKTTDTDMFSFTTNGGSIEIRVNGAAGTAVWSQHRMNNLIPKVQLFNAAGRQVGYAAATTTLGSGAVINANLAAGTYYASVSSLGDYGNVGQYTVSVKNVISATKSTETTPKGGLYAMDGSPTAVTASTSKTVAAPKGGSTYASDGPSAESSVGKPNYATKLTSPMPVIKTLPGSKPGGVRLEYLDEAFAGFSTRLA